MQCADYIELRKLNLLKEPDGRVIDWMEGFLTGINIVRLQRSIGDSIDIPDRRVLSIMTEGECYRDPLLSIYLAATGIAYNLVTQGKTFDVKKSMK